ncbi:amino acid permease C-terminal domain-containing protein [Plantactinospora sp. GCM10030261]|uniref:amino acid permease C-terminal domain-containing protein n=1 Tax=Plantactinospora sp. GCM10030261 TaxID=3273420 RepID=UPI003613EEED
MTLSRIGFAIGRDGLIPRGIAKVHPRWGRPFKVPFSPVLPIVSALACLYLMTNLSVETWLRFLAWLLLGALIYVGYGRRKNRLARRESEEHRDDNVEPAAAG